MRIIRKVAVLCAVFLLSCCLFLPVVYAVEEPEPHTPAIATTENEAAPTENTGAAEAATVSPGAAESAGIDTVSPAGTGTVIETVTEADGRKFYTITTPAGNVFYLVIDTSRQAENVYFLDAVTEKDLLALAEKTDNTTPEKPENKSVIPGTTDEAGTAATEQPPAAYPEQEQAAQDSNTLNIILIVIVAAAFGGAAYYFKIYRKRKEADMRDEYEADEPEEHTIDEYEANKADFEEYDDTDQEDDAPPWDDENDDVENENKEDES